MEKKRQSGDRFLNKIWPLILCALPLIAIAAVLIRAVTWQQTTAPKDRSQSFDSPQELAQTIGGRCELLRLDAGEYSDFSGALYFEQGKDGDSRCWENLFAEYITAGTDSECSLHVYFPAYPREIITAEDWPVLSREERGGATYYLEEYLSSPNSPDKKVESIVFERDGLTYVLELVSALDAGEDIWCYYGQIC